MLIFPAIDIINGKCVRLTQGDYARETVYREDPLDVAKEFEAVGLTHLHLVDLDGARSGRVTNWKVIEAICANTKLRVDMGGGIKTKDELQRLFDTGVDKANLGSIAVRTPEVVFGWIETFGDRIILSADVRNLKIAIGGWQEESSLDVFELIDMYAEKGVGFVTCTDISTDGTLQGPATELYKAILLRFPQMKLIASGGVGLESHLHQLASTGVYGVIVGKAIYEGNVSLETLTGFNASGNSPIATLS